MANRSQNKLIFPNTFFEDEVREGFFVTSMMKRYWACQIKILMEVAEICLRHDIKWFADFGTLIGAVRHKGFIPWDDDLDISMLRADWIRFFEAAKNEFPSEYVILTIDEQKEYREIFGRVVNSHFIDYSREHLEMFYGCPYTAGIDIFPLDGVYNDASREEERRERAKKLIDDYDFEQSHGDNPTKMHALIKKLSNIYSECSSDVADKVALMPFYISQKNHIYDKALFAIDANLPFETVSIKVPARYEDKLVSDYNTFMRINKSGGVHNYPVYSEQEQILKEKIGRNPYRYTLDYNALALAVKRYAVKTLNPKPVSNKKKVIFLPCRAKWWKSMEGLWRKAKADPNIETHVIPIFCYEADYNGQICEKHDERAFFPSYVNPEDCTKYDFESEHPDVIVIQVPYDGWSTFMTVHEYFYSSNLLNFTDELIYVPCFEADDPEKEDDKAWKSLSVLVEQPAVVNADKVVLSSEMMKKLYLSRMIELCGKETESYWNQKFVFEKDIDWGRGYELSDELFSRTEAGDFTEDSVGKAEWLKLIGGKSDKKVIVYYITINFMIKGGIKSIEKLRHSMEIFKDASDEIRAILLPQATVRESLGKADEGLLKAYIDLISQAGTTYENCVCDEYGICLDYMDKWDAFYGNEGYISKKCVEMGIPVMIQNIEI